MKFWNNLLKEIGLITNWIIKTGAELLEPLKSIDGKLSKEENYIANENPIKKINSSVTFVLGCNESRTKLIIQNIGLEPCYLKLDSRISKEDFHFVLAPDTSPNYGNGGSISLDNWHGKIYAICEKETKLSVLEY
ncbi:hypothetical protein CIW83_09705 [Tissierella sp. P1]|uniref:hypothetical protein n=1 Tax=Tissierella sp. P1 TaxID=1280483 RepID=UPI000BA1408D|nr:hypothetical protein [Tissierella sp. P1]OZV12362.1 hypothetical protein CIW83_09705 [Tissierella sp. P1]